MMKKINRYYFQVLIPFLFFSLPVFAVEQAGVVIIASGEVFAIEADNNQRKLKRRSKFFEGETLRVNDNSKAQVRFLDGTLVSLRADTEIRVDAFHYDENSNGDQDKNFFTLLKGGFRTITGAVGKNRPEAHQVNTPVATIGVRGTHYSAVFDSDLYVGVWQGGVSVKNEKGTIDIGMDAAFNFAQVANIHQSPKGMMKAPPVLLEQINISMAQPGTRTEEQQRSGEHEQPPKDSSPLPHKADGQDPMHAQNNGEPMPAPDGKEPMHMPDGGDPMMLAEGDPMSHDRTMMEQPMDAKDSTTHFDPMAGSDDTGFAPPPDPNMMGFDGGSDVDYTFMMHPDDMPMETYDGGVYPPPPEGDMFFEGYIDPFIEGDVINDTTLAGTDYVDQPINVDLNGDGIPDYFANLDQRLSDTEKAGLVYLAFVDPGSPSSGYNKFLGKSSDDIAGNPIFADNGLSPFDLGFNSTPTLSVFRKGPAPDAPSTPYTDPNYPVTWGKWDASPTNPAIVQDDPADPSITTTITSPVIWMRFLPTSPAAIAGLAGRSFYRNVINFNGNGSAGAIGALFFSTDIDFNTGLINGDVHVHNGTDFWLIDYDGNVTGNILDLNVLPTSKLNGIDSANGSIDAIFTGTNGNAFVGAFDFNKTGDLLTNVGSTFLVDNTLIGDLRLSSAEQTAIDRIGLLVFDAPSSIPKASNPALFNATDGASGSPIFEDTQLDPVTGFPLVVLRQDTATLSKSGADPMHTRPDDFFTVTLDASWGAWNEDLANIMVAYNDENDPLLGFPVSEPLHWISVLPTPTATLAGITGSFSYGGGSPSNAISLEGFTTNGTITSWSGSATVDFGTATVSSGNLNFSTSTFDTWDINYFGTLNGAKLNILPTDVTGTLNGGLSIQGFVDGYITGPKAEGIAGVFDVELVGVDTTHAGGSFVLGCDTNCP